MFRLSERSGEHPSRSMPDLEVLLRSDETALYGQVCWSLANRGTERPTAGDVITPEGGVDAADPTTRTFRLTGGEHRAHRGVPGDADSVKPTPRVTLSFEPDDATGSAICADEGTGLRGRLPHAPDLELLLTSLLLNLAAAASLSGILPAYAGQ